jgi:hypothetical protein
MRAQFASLWNLLQECRSLEPRAGKIALHRPESFLTRRIERNARCLNVAFTIPAIRVADCRAGRRRSSGGGTKNARARVGEPISFYGLFEMS